ncbi:zinc finger protein [Phlyctochytrium arcticum]|nr:zinc finger protein [Phlyctochytrium arcticum]
MSSSPPGPRRSPRKPLGKPNTPSNLTPLQQKEQDPSLNIIPEPSLHAIAQYIKENKVKQILVLTGAGISTSAGIPDFRSPGTGLYDNLKKYNLPYPEAIFDISYFRRNPQPFFTLARELYPGTFRSTPCHYFIRLLQDKGILLRNFTQNIDTLERIAGVREEVLVEAHGSFAGAACAGKTTVTSLPKLASSLASASGNDSLASPPLLIESDQDSSDDDDTYKVVHPGCGKVFSTDSIRERIFKGEIPICDSCQGYIKPDIVFFGEQLPPKFHEAVATDFFKTDLVIIIGTSLQVAPFSQLINLVPATVPRLLINREIVGIEPVSQTRGFDFTGDRHKYRRDAVFLGGCDDGCWALAELLGWKEELQSLMDKELKKLKPEQSLVSDEKAETKSDKLAQAIAETAVESSHGDSKLDATSPTTEKELDKDEAELIAGMEKLMSDVK